MMRPFVPAADEDVDAAEALIERFSEIARGCAADIVVTAAVRFACDIFLASNLPRRDPARFAELALFCAISAIAEAKSAQS